MTSRNMHSQRGTGCNQNSGKEENNFSERLAEPVVQKSPMHF
jgi:hypothetical protein